VIRGAERSPEKSTDDLPPVSIVSMKSGESFRSSGISLVFIHKKLLSVSLLIIIGTFRFVKVKNGKIMDFFRNSAYFHCPA